MIKWYPAAVACGLIVLTVPALAEDVADTWNLNDMFPTTQAWDKARDEVAARLAQIDACQGQLGKSEQRLLECSELISDIVKQYSLVASYASLSADADTRVTENQQRRSEAQILGSDLSQKLAFINPEILKIDRDKLQSWLKEDPKLQPYAQGIRDTLRQAEHTLDERGEEMLAATSLMQAGPNNVYRTLANADMPWPTIKLASGEEVRLDQAAYTKYRSDADRAERKEVMDAFFGTWKKFERTIGTVLSSEVDTHVFSARQRHYKSSLAAALDANNIPEAVYHTLIRVTNENLDTLYRYFKLRGRMLGIEQLHYYDIYPPLVNSDRKFALAEAKRLTLEATRPLGKAYDEVLASGFENRWMDAYPRPGKVSGAYMQGGAYDVHPYVLMNYNDDYESVSTLAHEWGHAMHSYLSSRNQPYPTAQYSIFLAEIASTFNEALLLDHMLKQAANDEERLYYLGSALENIRGTFYRQTMFAEFELMIHQKAESGEALSGADFTKMYGELLRRYHGEAQGVMKIDDPYPVEWAYIPHFYRNFYVYQYATSMAASSLLSQEVLQGQPGAVDKYLNLLKAGGSDYPYDLLKRAGVDMATDAPYQAVVNRMNEIMDRIEAILDAREK